VLRAVTVSLVIVAAACSGHSKGRESRSSTALRSTTTTSTVEAKAAALDCSAPIDSARTPPAGFQSIGGAIALETSASDGTALQTSATRQPGVERLFAKNGLFVRAGTKAELIVPSRWVGSLALHWRNAGGPVSRLDVGPCTGDAWIVFPGGYYVSRPACVELIVRVSSVDHLVSMGVGAPCPGQRPPPQPSSR
jgi:hypothetical protein